MPRARCRTVSTGFCDSASCGGVYFGGQRTFAKSDLKVPVGVKEKSREPSLVLLLRSFCRGVLRRNFVPWAVGCAGRHPTEDETRRLSVRNRRPIRSLATLLSRPLPWRWMWISPSSSARKGYVIHHYRKKKYENLVNGSVTIERATSGSSIRVPVRQRQASAWCEGTDRHWLPASHSEH